MILPSLLIPTYIAGTTDTLVSEICLNELKSIYEKFSDYFASYFSLVVDFYYFRNFIPGLKLCFYLHSRKANFSLFNVDHYIDIINGLQKFYQIFKSSNKLRNIWLKSILEQLVKEMDLLPKSKSLYFYYIYL